MEDALVDVVHGVAVADPPERRSDVGGTWRAEGRDRLLGGWSGQPEGRRGKVGGGQFQALTKKLGDGGGVECRNRGGGGGKQPPRARNSDDDDTMNFCVVTLGDMSAPNPERWGFLAHRTQRPVRLEQSYAKKSTLWPSNVSHCGHSGPHKIRGGSPKFFLAFRNTAPSRTHANSKKTRFDGAENIRVMVKPRIPVRYNQYNVGCGCSHFSSLPPL